MNEKKEYIERGALIDSFENCYYLYGSTDRETVRQAIENAPAADVVPVVHGEWILEDADEYGYTHKCTACETRFKTKIKLPPGKHCPECGAKMDGGSDAS